MQTLATITQQDIDPASPFSDTSGFRIREASRAILFDAQDKVYLLNVSLHGYHKLPGGGIKDGEEIKAALQRELLEEVGCRAEIITELGAVVEFRDFENLKQTSYCFIARQKGEQQESALEADELEEGMIEVKADSIDAAIELVQKDQPDSIEGKFIQRRDLAFLSATKSLSKS
ncbi:NUDIX domain-containing protein [Candidatus Saccharibacteria bacterium]|jgi:8-oxo-dGTP diphosphatase|nr:NUDIX domain-containing protein [Candidatus Saccharibacteria bacterium]